MSRPRILLLTRNYPPLWGGMERLVWRMSHELAGRADLRLVLPLGSAPHAPSDAVASEVPGRPIARFLLASARAALLLSRRVRPAWVLAGSGLLAPAALAAARASGARAATYLHGLDAGSAHPAYSALWLPVIRRLDLVIANSRATAAIARGRRVPAERIRVVRPGVDLPEPDPAAREHFRARHGLGGRPVLLYVGRLTRRKGLVELVRDVLPLVLRERPDAILLVAGDTPAASLHRGTVTREAVRAAARAANVQAALRFLGVLDGPALDETYFAADVHVFPVRDIPGDPEGFGMVALEAAAHGLPTVAYATGGITEAVADGVSGRLVPPGDPVAFAAAVLELLAAPPPADAMRKFAERFAWERFGDKLAQALGLEPEEQ